jgi:hypothetical protein
MLPIAEPLPPNVYAFVRLYSHTLSRQLEEFKTACALLLSTQQTDGFYSFANAADLVVKLRQSTVDFEIQLLMFCDKHQPVKSAKAAHLVTQAELAEITQVVNDSFSRVAAVQPTDDGIAPEFMTGWQSGPGQTFVVHLALMQDLHEQAKNGMYALQPKSTGSAVLDFVLKLFGLKRRGDNS